MIELLINEFLNTYPFHLFAYFPFHNMFRYSIKKTCFFSVLAETIYLIIFYFLVHVGFPAVYVQYTGLPILGVFMLFLVHAPIGMILFQYTFVIDYLMVVRVCAFFLCKYVLHCGLFSWQSGLATLFFVLCSAWFMAMHLNKIIDTLSSVQAPTIWKTAWLLPFASTMIIFLLTGTIRNGGFTNLALFARVLLLSCMFLFSHSLALMLRFFKGQIESATYSHNLEKIMLIQQEQYNLLIARIRENRRIRHDFRQHLAVIHDCLNRDDLSSLKAYLNEYEQLFPIQDIHSYCSNYAVNAILSFYAEKAAANKIPLQTNVQIAEPLLIPESEFCVLLGNLLENALESCKLDTSSICPPFIRLHIQQLSPSMLSITSDNTSAIPPRLKSGHLLSSKHEGTGIGTDSIRNIAERYHGDARFTWKDGIFYASITLNP